MTILLVDDERQVLDGIRHGVDFEALGLDEVLTARSGEEAREIIEKTRVEGRRQWYQITEKGMQMVLQEIQRMQQMIDDGIDIIHHD